MSKDETSQPTIYSRDEHTLSRADIDTDALKIMYRLIRHGYKAYLVGGGVRDLLLGKRPKDFDIATDATPRKIKNLFRNCRIIGRRFKLAHVYFRNQKVIEVSTFRDISQPIEMVNAEDEEGIRIERDNTFGTPATDAIRRDLTINALFYDLSNFTIIDYVGGIQDLQNKTIRIIGDPYIRYQEDPVRMIRVVRHAARAGFDIEQKTLEVIQDHHGLIKEAAQVRVYEEIKKDFSTGSSLQTLRLLANSGLLEHILPELLLNGAVLLKEGSYFSEVMSRIDGFVTDSGSEPPITPVLAVIALFLTSYPDSFDSLLVQFNESVDRDEISDHLKSCFIQLSVPRKERERIEDVLALWLRLHQSQFERVEKMNLERRRCIQELNLMMKWLEDSGHDGKLLGVVSEAANNKSHPRGGRGQKKTVQRGKNQKNRGDSTRNRRKRGR